MNAYLIRISLVGAVPPIWRRVYVPAEITFKRLHDVIQYAMGWQDCHLYEFEIPSLKTRITCDEEDDDYRHGRSGWDMKLAGKVKIDRFMQKGKPIKYTYDFGDDWVHRIELEEISEGYPVGYPMLIDGAGACPPEDGGGLGGYLNFLEAILNQHHPDHQELVEWGTMMGYREFDREVTKNLLSGLKLKRLKPQV